MSEPKRLLAIIALCGAALPVCFTVVYLLLFTSDTGFKACIHALERTFPYLIERDFANECDRWDVNNKAMQAVKK